MFELLFIGDNHGGHYVVYINPSGDGRVGFSDKYNNNRCLNNITVLKLVHVFLYSGINQFTLLTEVPLISVVQV